MPKTIVQLSEIKIIGIKCRTNNLSEMQQSTAKISPMIQQYFHSTLAEKITNRKKPGTTYCIYTDYENDFTGDYTYFIGEEVTCFDNLPEGFSKTIIPSQNYTKFITGPGVMPDVCVRMWQQIWAMSSEDLGGTREYLADFELYDERACDPKNIVFDIYIGIKK